MTETTIQTIKKMLETSIEETDDPDIRFKLEQALQLVASVEKQHVETHETLEDAEIETSVRENLKALGYL